ncbi:sensor histidine kinase [Lacinutrix salivirga]
MAIEKENLNQDNTIDIYKDLKWQLALNISNVGIWDYNSELNKVFFSRASKAIIGFEDDASFGDDPNAWNNRVHPDDREKYFQDFQNHLNGLQPIYENKHRILCKDGSYKWVLDRGKVIEKNEEGKEIRVIGTHVDITETVNSEENNHIALKIATEQNNKLKNFAHIVTHNLKQHAGNLESLLQFYIEAKTIEEKEELINHLNAVSHSLSKTIANLNDVVSVQSKKQEVINKIYIAKEIDTIMEMLNMVIAESNATIYNKVDPKLYVYYNAAYFESVIQNLLTNAIKYKHPDRDPVITIESHFSSDAVRVTITDNGIGIDLNKYGKDIFGLYKTFHNNSDSEGVGLYLIKNQIETFGGSITVNSEVNKGTTFTITARRH